VLSVALLSWFEPPLRPSYALRLCPSDPRTSWPLRGSLGLYMSTLRSGRCDLLSVFMYSFRRTLGVPACFLPRLFALSGFLPLQQCPGTPLIVSTFLNNPSPAHPLPRVPSRSNRTLEHYMFSSGILFAAIFRVLTSFRPHLSLEDPFETPQQRPTFPCLSFCVQPPSR